MEFKIIFVFLSYLIITQIIPNSKKMFFSLKELYYWNFFTLNCQNKWHYTKFILYIRFLNKSFNTVSRIDLFINRYKICNFHFFVQGSYFKLAIIGLNLTNISLGPSQNHKSWGSPINYWLFWPHPPMMFRDRHHTLALYLSLLD